MRNHGTARVLLERAVALEPNTAWGWSRLGWLETYDDHPEVAIRHFEHALRLSPLDPMNLNNPMGIGAAHEVRQDFDQAARHFRRALQERPHACWIFRSLAPTLGGAGRWEEAREAFTILMEHYPDLTCSKVRRAMVYSPPVIERMCEHLRVLGLPE